MANQRESSRVNGRRDDCNSFVSRKESKETRFPRRRESRCVRTISVFAPRIPGRRISFVAYLQVFQDPLATVEKRSQCSIACILHGRLSGLGCHQDRWNRLETIPSISNFEDPSNEDRAKVCSFLLERDSIEDKIVFRATVENRTEHGERARKTFRFRSARNYRYSRSLPETNRSGGKTPREYPRRRLFAVARVSRDRELTI